MGKAAKAVAAPAVETGEAPAKGGKKKLLLMAVPLVLAAIGAGLWFTGILPPLLGLGKHEQKEAAASEVKPPSFVELPEIVANLNAGNRKPSYVKVHIRLQLTKPEDEPALKAVMPRLLDLFQTYLREMRPEELRGSEGVYRLREELIGRANVAAAPVRIVDVLFTEMLVQ